MTTSRSHRTKWCLWWIFIFISRYFPLMFSHQHESQKTRQDEIFVSISRMHILHLQFWVDGVLIDDDIFRRRIESPLLFPRIENYRLAKKLNNPVVKNQWILVNMENDGDDKKVSRLSCELTKIFTNDETDSASLWQVNELEFFKTIVSSMYTCLLVIHVVEYRKTRGE